MLHTSLKQTFYVVANLYFYSHDENSHSSYYGNMNHKDYPDTMIFYHLSPCMNVALEVTSAQVAAILKISAG